ncbi:hypothetical protein ACFTXB_16460 [Streptomyces sp. NPDC057074]|uniref:hypothetical protein n=1 Tax=Streptomyces sp. NPDC057074 TaxID=3346015 RepID=UPI00363EBD80
MRVDFSVPVEFEEVPLGMDFAAAWDEVCARGARESQMPEADEESLSEMARTLEAISRSLAASGVLYAGNCLHSFEGEISLGSLAVAVVDYAYGDDPATAARGTLRGVIESRGDGWTGSVIDAPCGQAVVFTGGQSYVLPPVFSPTGESVEVLTAQFHAMIPAPVGADGVRRMCLLAFSTPQIGHWEKCYAPIIADVLRSLRFAEDTAGERLHESSPQRAER